MLKKIYSEFGVAAKKVKDFPITAVKATASVFNSLRYSFSVSWKSSKMLTLTRICIILVNGFVPTINMFIGKHIIDNLTNGAGQYDKHIKNLVFLLGISLSLLVISIVMQRINEISQTLHADLISNHVNLEIMEKTSKLDLSFFDNPAFYNELTNSRRDSGALQNLVWSTTSVVQSSISFVTSISVLVLLHWSIPLILILLNIPAIIVERGFRRYSYRWARSRAPEERKMGYLQKIITDRGHAKDIRLFGLYDSMLFRYITLWKKWYGEKKKITISKGKWSVILSTLPLIGMTSYTLYLAMKVLKGFITLGSYTFYSGMASQLVGNANSIIYTLAQVYESDMKITNYKKFMQWEPRLLAYGDGKVDGNPTIEFRDVSFKYPYTDKYILNKLNFVINPCEKVALVGLNGAGKTTITKLLMGFYDPTEGQILINGIDMHEYSKDEVNKLFSAVFQDYANYAFSVRESISLSDIDNANNEERIYEACQRSGADKVIEKFKKGYDSYLTKTFEDDGEELSGGQWQKIALARAFFRDAKVLVLDEPTSSLDPEAEYEIFQKFASLCDGKSALLVSHRLSSVTMADKIIVIEHGKIIESGSHENLLKASGRYAQLFNMQAEKYIAI